MRNLRCLAILCLSVVSANSVQAQRARNGVDAVTAAQLRDYLTFIASDELEGRDTPSRGLDTAAKFIAALCSRWGLKPGGDDGTFFQTMVFRRDKVASATTSAALGGRIFKLGEEFACAARPASVSAGAVYVGDGWTIKAKNVDAFAGLDVSGKVVVANYSTAQSPRGTPRTELKGKEGEDWLDPAANAAKHKAAAILFIIPAADSSAWSRMNRAMDFPQRRIVSAAESAQPGIPTFYASDVFVKELFAGEQIDGPALLAALAEGKPAPGFALQQGKILALKCTVDADVQTTQNVVAIWEGRDPKLKSEYIAIGAHYDHVGVTQRPVNGDHIFNGADDDGSGTVAILAIGEALSKARTRPKRSVLIVWHAGEEKGLLGSEFFTARPTVPIGSIVAQLNIDMIGRSKPAGDTKPVNKELTGPDEIYVIGSKLMSTDLGALSEKVNERYLKLRFNYLYDDPGHPAGFFYRSDHYNYAKRGIPIIFYFSGTHEDYHRLGDHIEKIDFAKMEKVTRTVYQTMWELAEQTSRPKVDKPLAASVTRR